MKSTKYPILILKRAQDDLRDIRKFYNTQQKDLGIRFLREAKTKIKVLQSNPLGYQLRYHTVRMVHLSVFPISIHFEILNETVIILAVTHTSIDPKKWPMVG